MPRLEGERTGRGHTPPHGPAPTPPSAHGLRWMAQEAGAAGRVGVEPRPGPGLGMPLAWQEES